MESYYFLFVLAFLYILFASFQDLRTREIANWLSFSLIAFVLAYRAFYANHFNDWNFFLFGVIGVLLFVGFGYALYYGRVFAGGDAKLLMGLGGVFPYNNYLDFVFLGGGFVLLLLFVGSVYGLVYTVFLIRKNWKNFKQDFVKEFRKRKTIFFGCLALAVIFQLSLIFFRSDFIALFSLLFVLLPFLYIYAKAVENSCMVRLVSPQKLTEGDWLNEDVLVNGKKIKKNFEGLSWTQIKSLRKSDKKVWIKDGVPFAPAFLIAFLIMVFVFLI